MKLLFSKITMLSKLLIFVSNKLFIVNLIESNLRGKEFVQCTHCCSSINSLIFFSGILKCVFLVCFHLWFVLPWFIF